MAKQDEKNNEQSQQEIYGSDGFTEALRDALEKPEILQSILIAAKAWASTRPEEIKLRFRMLHLTILLALIIFAGIGIMGWYGIISKEVTSGLLGSLIGYLYGQGRKA